MAQVITIIGFICSPHMIMFVPLLLIIGYHLKHYTNIPNGYIPTIEVLCGMAIGAVYAVTARPENELITSIVMYVAQGAVLGAVSVTFYDALHGTIGHKCPIKEESEMAEQEKKKFNPFDYAVCVYGLAVFASVVACGLIELGFHGVEGMLVYLRDYAHYNIITCIVVDILSKVSKDRTSIVWQYWVMVALIALADIAYVFASITTTFLAMWICFGIIVTLLAGASLWCLKMYKPAVEKKRETVLAQVNSDLIDLGVPEATVGKVTNYFFGR